MNIEDARSSLAVKLGVTAEVSPDGTLVVHCRRVQGVQDRGWAPAPGSIPIRWEGYAVRRLTVPGDQT